MELIHHYSARQGARVYAKIEPTARLTCNKLWTKYSELEHAPTSIPWNATCPDCLDKLIPPARAKLEKMEQARSLSSKPPLTEEERNLL